MTDTQWEELVKFVKTLSEEERAEFTKDVSNLLRLNNAYAEKAKSLGLL